MPDGTKPLARNRDQVTTDNKTAFWHPVPLDRLRTRLEETFMRRILVVLVPLLLAVSTITHAADRMRFWNLTGTTIKELHLAPVGTTTWGPNQCANDKDGS